MKNSIFLILFLSYFYLSNKINAQEVEHKYTQIIEQEFQTILDSANVGGVIILLDLNNNIYYSNNFKKANQGHLPASTFKIPNSIIGLETGVIKNKNEIFKWNGEKRYLSVWEKDLNLEQAFQLSCVPCYQEVARKIGVDRMNEYLKKLDYGTMEINTKTIDNFWLDGNSRISPIQQIDFLKSFYLNELPISKSTYQIMKSILQIKIDKNYILSGKTGWSTRNGIDNGWFVGYVESNKNVYFFATNIEPGKDFKMNLFANIRKTVTIEALKSTDVIK